MKNISIFFHDSKPFTQLVGLFFIFLVGFIIATGFSSVLTIRYATPAEIRLSLLSQAVSQLFIFLVPAVLFAVLFHGGGHSFLKLGIRKNQWKQLLAAVVIFIMMIPLNDWITSWNDGWNLGPLEKSMRQLTQLSKDTMSQMLSLTGVGDLLLQLFVVALVPAVSEELFFRGALQQTLHKWFGNPHAAIVMASLLFSLAHGDLYGFVPRLLLGLLLGYLFLLSGSMLVNICAHFFNNALIVVMYFFYNKGELLVDPSEPLMTPWITTILCTLAAVALFVLYFVKNSVENDLK